MPLIFEKSETGIANAALSHIGASMRIVSITDDTSPEARVLKENYPRVRDAVLRAYPWNCAGARASLAASATAPAFGYSYAYPLPTDYLWLRGLADSDRVAYEVESGEILTDVAAPLRIKYTRTLLDVTKFDPLLYDAIAIRLAAACCVALTESVSRAEGLQRLYMGAITEARRLDAQEGQAEQMPEVLWVTERL